jgi:hypothetical protein
MIVFGGPTLAGAAVKVAPFRLLPPARQGDLFRAMEMWRPAAVGLIDGVFLDVPSIWHREILWAMAQGVHVYGAASMGALRAAELAPFGMHGVGMVFEAYRDGLWPGFPGAFEDDDEVAVTHAPEAAGSAALSDAMVDLRATLLAAQAAGVIDRAACLRLAAALKRRHFAQRSLSVLGRFGGAALRAWLPHGAVAQKRADALALLARMRADRPLWAEPHRPNFRFERALVWERFAAAESARLREAQARARADTLGRPRKEDVDAWLRGL